MTKQQTQTSVSTTALNMRDLFPHGEKVVATTRFSGKDAEVAGFFRRSALRAGLSCTTVRAAVVVTEAPIETSNVEPAVSVKSDNISSNLVSGSTVVACKCLGNFENTNKTDTTERDVVMSNASDKPVVTMFGLSVSDYERALVTASAQRRAKRARVADEACNERPIKIRRTNKSAVANKEVSTVESLLQAVRSGNQHLARKVLRKISSQDKYTEIVEHALHECIVSGVGAKVIRVVLAECTRVLGRAAATTEFAVPACSIVSGEYPTSKLSLLCDAVRHCSYEQVRAFLEYGFDPDFRMVSGCTALMVSAYKNDTRMIELLCDFGSDVSATMENGVSAIAVAAFQGNVEAVNLLIAKGAQVDQPTADGTTALMTAVQESHADVVKALLNAGAQINLCKPNGSSPIIVAVRHRRVSMIPLLGQAGCDPNLVLSNGASALVLACANGDLACVNELISLNADVSRPLNSGATALEYACHRGHKEIVACLLKSLPTKLEDSRLQRLTVVAESRNNEELITLLRTYAKADFTDLHYAVFLDDIKTVHKRVRTSETNFSADMREQLLALAKPACAAYLRRAFAPFTADNKDLWPESFVTVADKVLKEKTDIMQHVFSFCGRDWFAKN